LRVTEVSSFLSVVQHNWQLVFVGLNISDMLEGINVGLPAEAMDTVPWLLSKHLFK